MGCCSGCARWIIGIINICVIICAIVAAVVVYKREKDEKWSDLIKNNVAFIFILVAMAFAIFSAIIGLLLCCCKKKCLYVTYLIIIFIVIIIEVVAIVLAFVYHDNIIDGIADNWMKSEYSGTVGEVEKAFKCCGFDDEHKESNCQYVPEDKSEEVPTCKAAIDDKLKSNMKSLRIAVIVMACVELLLLICALYLVCCNKKDDAEGIAKF